MRLIVGLGNPGREYSNNRHNVGFRCLDYFARKQGISFKQRATRSLLGVGDVEGVKVMLAKPRTFMNRSGEAVVALLHRHHLSTTDLIVVYDDLDLLLGRLRVRESGGAGGHNGMKSIIKHLGSNEFTRIRVGVAPHGEAGAQSIKTPEYVLSNLSTAERRILKDAYLRVAGAINCLLIESTEAAMNKYNNLG